MAEGFLSKINDPNTVITPIDTAIRFPEILAVLLAKYREDIELFSGMVAKAKSSAELLDGTPLHEPATGSLATGAS